MSLDHFSHEHPLIFKEEWDDNGEDQVLCFGCQNQVISGSTANVYICSKCDDFYLHKKCAELVKEIQHPIHEPHPLTLLAQVQINDEDDDMCNVCRSNWRWFTYRCDSCYFNLCLTCAVEDRVLCHKGHHMQHTLTLMQREAVFYCDACDTEAKDFSYACNSCQFWMHKSCALSENIVEVGFHHHPLVLTFSIPDHHRTFWQYCAVCDGVLLMSSWFYYCYKCTYFVHIKCMTTTTSISGDNSDTEVESQNELDLVKLPVLDKESMTDLIMELFTRWDINITQGMGDASTPDHPQTLVQHWSHEDHPLVLLGGIQSMEDDEMLICNACVQPISAANRYYGCVKCNFFLHKFCSELPDELHAGTDSSHPEHPLALSRPDAIYDLVTCAACQLETNGFFYWCEECDISFDIRCVQLPNRIKYKSHKHPLVDSEHSNVICFACSASVLSTDQCLKCESGCWFEIHKRCALLPKTVSHRWDPHPIPLVYPPFFHEGQVYCDICEEEIDPNYWLYHCSECDHSFHVECLQPSHNVKYGDKRDFGLHKHTITFVRREEVNYGRCLVCHSCCEDLGEISFVFECANCDVLFCISCVRNSLNDSD